MVVINICGLLVPRPKSANQNVWLFPEHHKLEAVGWVHHIYLLDVFYSKIIQEYTDLHMMFVFNTYNLSNIQYQDLYSRSLTFGEEYM